MHASAAWFGFCAALFSSTCLAQLPNPNTPNGSGLPRTGMAQFGQDVSRAITFTPSTSPQQAVFTDGLTFSIQSIQPLRMNVGIQRGVSRVTLPMGIPSLNTFAYIVNTSAPYSAINAQINVPISMEALSKIVPNSPVLGSTVRGAVLMVARRPLNSGGIMFERIPGQQMPFVPVTTGPNAMNTLQVSGLTNVDGEYVILVANPDDDSIFDTVSQRDQVRQALAVMSGSEKRASPAALFILILFSSLSLFIPAW